MIRGVLLAGQLNALLIAYLLIAFFGIFAYVFVFVQYLIYGLMILAVGISVGIVSGYLNEKRELRSIEKKGEYKVSRATAMMILVVLVGIIVAYGFVQLILPLSFWSNLSRAQLDSVSIFFYLIPPSMIATRIQMIKAWQRKNQRVILNDSGFFSTRVYAAAAPMIQPVAQ